MKKKNNVELTISDKDRRIEFTNDFMFATIMKDNEDICRRVLECILGFEIKSLKYVEDQYTLQSYSDNHGIRLDVIAKDTGATYDIEMQTVNKDDIPKRMRYYQSQIDVAELKKGRQYKHLKDSYVIFICTFDVFGKKEYIYRFENYDIEKGLSLGDGTKKIVVNAKGSKGDISEELKDLIAYIDKPDRASKKPHTDLVEEIDTQVDKTNKDTSWRNAFMKLEIELMNREELGREEGKLEGRKEGLDIATKIFRLFRDGKSEKQIASAVGLDVATVRGVLG